MKSRRQMIEELEEITSKLNARCDLIAEEVWGLESELQRIHVGVHVRVVVDSKEYGYARHGDRFRIGLYDSHGNEFKPVGELSREEKIGIEPHLDTILQAIVTAASEQLKGLT